MHILDVQNAIKKFTTFSFGNTDYSGFDLENWTPRTAALHRQNFASILQETTKTNIRKKEAECGARYSILLGLPYFDPVRFTVIDTMHNLYLGTANYLFRLWLEIGIITPADLKEIDERCQVLKIPNNTGRLPTNISLNYGGFKASHYGNRGLLCTLLLY